MKFTCAANEDHGAVYRAIAVHGIDRSTLTRFLSNNSIMNHNRITIVAGLILSFASTNFVDAANWFVTTKPGKNSGQGTKQDPFSNLAHAFNDKAANGDTIYLTDGTHLSNACENFYAVKSDIIICPEPGAEKVVFDCSKQSLAKNYGGINIASRASNITIQDIEVINDLTLPDDQRGVNNPIGIGIVLGGNGHVIQRCIVHSTWKAGIRVVSGAKDTKILNNKVYDANKQNRNASGGVYSPKGLPIGIQIAGIDIFNADNITATGNEVWNVYGEGLLLNRSRNITIANNVVYDVFSTSIYCDNGQMAKIHDNKIYSKKEESFYRMNSPAVGIGISNENLSGGGTKDVEVYNNDITDARICLFYWKNPANKKGTQGCNFHDNKCKAGWEALIQIMPDTHTNFAVTNNQLDSSPTGNKLVEIPVGVKSEGNTVDGKPAIVTEPAPLPPEAGPVIADQAPPEGQVGKAYKFQIVASNSAASYSVKGKLPKGLALDQKTGLISGTPAPGTAGSYTVILKAYNSRGPGEREVTIAIK
jgi:Putative Ig domain/Right handed beta helix region